MPSGSKDRDRYWVTDTLYVDPDIYAWTLEEEPGKPYSRLIVPSYFDAYKVLRYREVPREAAKRQILTSQGRVVKR